MTDPFRQFFLNTIEDILKEEPSKESLHKLLITATPNLTVDQIVLSSCARKNNTNRNNSADGNASLKALKTLKSRVHPDKHPQDKRATELFQSIQIFYDDCISSPQPKPSSSLNNSRKRRKQSTILITEQNFPSEFDTTVNCPHMKLHHPRPPSSSNNSHDKATTTAMSRQQVNSINLPFVQAFKCLNGRGALAHGRPITRHFSWEDVEQRQEEDVMGNQKLISDVFNSIGGGTRELQSVREIKDEILNRGPVVSVSFHLCEAYLNQVKNRSGMDKRISSDENCGDCDLCGGFLKKRVGGEHELLIVGWCLTSFGEMWKVLPLWESITDSDDDDDDDDDESNTEEEMPSATLIGFGQFGIDDLCLAPESNLDHLSWQHGPYFDSNFIDVPEWREWKEMDLPLSGVEFQALAKCFKNTKGLVDAATTGACFVIRDQSKPAHSATYRLKEVRWEENTKEWIVTVLLDT